MARRLKEGDRAPDFTLDDDAGNPVRLYRILERGPVMLVFYPAAFTRVCTAQVCDYRDRWADFDEFGVTILGVSTDPPGKQASWRADNALPFPLLSDADGGVVKQFTGASRLMGGRAHRGNYIITTDGVIRYAYTEKIDLMRRGSDELLSRLRLLRQQGHLPQ
jgi:thioredoxin-dependent peroxiredoxin